MLSRQNQGKRPQITFTSDFHELVQGDLVPGPCVLRYDPLRIVPETDRGGEHHIEVHVRFHPGGSEWHHVLTVPRAAPLKTLADPAGQGYMLEAAFDLPPHCNELEVWFSCKHPDGRVDWDSDFGKNHWLRFALHDLELGRAAVVGSRGAALDHLDLDVTSVRDVDAIDVRWRATSVPGSGRSRASLRCVSTVAGRKRWQPDPSGILVPHGATLAFDLVYRVGPREFTDDNQGRWYIAD